MPHRQLPLIELDWQLSNALIIPAMRLESELARARACQHAQQDAVAIIKAARRKAVQMMRQANDNLRQQQAMAQEALACRQREVVQQCEATWLKQHVVSLQEDAVFEQRIIAALSARIRHCIERVLIAWYQQQPTDDTLCDRLVGQIERMAGQESLTLHISPAVETQLRAVLGDRYQIICDPQLARDEAMLASSRQTVSFSLERHFEQLLDWLRTAGGDVENTGVADGNH